MKTELNTQSLFLYVSLSSPTAIHICDCFLHLLIRQASLPLPISQRDSQYGSREREASLRYNKDIHAYFPYVLSCSSGLFTSRQKHSVKFSPFSQVYAKPGLVSLHFQQPKINCGVNRQVKWKKKRKAWFLRDPSGFKPKNWCFEMALLQNSLLKAWLFAHESGSGIFQLLHQSSSASLKSELKMLYSVALIP